MKKKILAVLVASCVVLTACDKPASSNNGTPAQNGSEPMVAVNAVVVKIGSATPMTGANATWGSDTDHGVRLAVEEANKEGISLDGHPVIFEVVTGDDQADPKMATAVAQRMVDDKVVGVIGHLTSCAAIPASTIYNKAGIPMISGSVTAPKYTQQGYNNVFRLVSDDNKQGVALADFAVKTLNFKRVAIVDDTTAYGQGLADAFEKSVIAAGGTVVKREHTNDKANDFKAILTSIQAQKPEVVFFGGMFSQGGTFAKQMKTLGMSAKYMGADGSYSPEFIKLAGDAAEGVYASSTGAPKELLPEFASFQVKFKAKFNKEADTYAPYTYDATHVMIAAMKAANSADPKKYLPELAKIQYKGVIGDIAFESNGDIKNGAITLYQVKSGKWELVKN
ncbi:MAG: branched-chain amino acid ABC transporter substrate-binding protein [Neisseriaceae bacterium]|nr:branched-chain amino acid ABC transporter substrate-binding protein [Neisseriaceae bacterium]